MLRVGDGRTGNGREGVNEDFIKQTTDRFYIVMDSYLVMQNYGFRNGAYPQNLQIEAGMLLHYL